MPVLALDTSTRRQSVAVASPDAILAEERLQAGATPSEILLPAVERVLEAAAIPPGELDAVAVTAGPGSFTGLRVGLSTAKGLALAAGVPVGGVSTLKVLAEALAAAAGGMEAAAVCALMEAGRGQLYRGIYRPAAGNGSPWSLAERGEERLVLPGEALAGLPEGTVAGGPVEAGHWEAAAASGPRRLSRVEPLPALASLLARQAAWLHARGAFPGEPLQPNYIRPPDALAKGLPRR